MIDQTGYQIDPTISHFAGSPSFRVHGKTIRLTTQRCRPSEFPLPSRLAVECIVCACHLCKAAAPEHGPAWARARGTGLGARVPVYTRSLALPLADRSL